MKKRKSSTIVKELKPIKFGFQSAVSIYKGKFFETDRKMTFRPKFSITKNIKFTSHKKIANNLAKTFERLKPLKF